MKYVLIALIFCGQLTMAQELINLSDLSAFKNPEKNWQIKGNVNADINKKDSFTTEDGTGILFSEPTGKHKDLFTKDSYGDCDLEFDFMLGKESNSGVYLQGNYEVQLYDSWGKKNAKYNDLGGIYQRWNDEKPEGQKGYEGYAPRVNVAKAPGLWQHMKIEFQAAKFNSSGEKTQNAKIIKITLNNQVIHENVNLTGVTRGAAFKESPTGPIRFQGDHGAIAFKNIIISDFKTPQPKLNSVNYKVSYTNAPENVDVSTLNPDFTKTENELTWEVSTKNNFYVLDIDSDFTVEKDGDYTFTLQVPTYARLSIDNKMVIPHKWGRSNMIRQGTTHLAKGKHTLRIINNKKDGWLKPTLGLWVEGPGFRKTPLHSTSSVLADKPTDPILLEAKAPMAHRSFMDIDKKTRIVHNISVGSPDNIHYSYNLDNGSIFQVWRGGFLDATPMWNSRGDGSARPLGSLTPLNNNLTVAKLSNSNAPWPTDTLNTGYKPKGYKINDTQYPEFIYLTNGVKVNDKLVPTEGKYFSRTIEIEGSKDQLFILLAKGENIKKVSQNLYSINNSSYFIKTEAKATIRNTNELILPVTTNSTTYSILF